MLNLLFILVSGLIKSYFKRKIADLRKLKVTTLDIHIIKRWIKAMGIQFKVFSSELKTLELWILRLMLDPLFFLKSRLT